jgi:predicted RNA binding protein YcfA (HicA-like mRNA interferase family)
MAADLPAINPKDLIKILEIEGWQIKRRANHGLAMAKYFDGKNHITIIPTKDKSMPKGTLMAILGMKQTQIGREHFLELYKAFKGKM